MRPKIRQWFESWFFRTDLWGGHDQATSRKIERIAEKAYRAGFERGRHFQRCSMAATAKPGITPPKTPMKGGFSLDKFMPGLKPEDAEAFANALESADLSEPDLTKCPKCGGPAELGHEFASMGSAEQARFFNEIYKVVMSEYAHGLSDFQLNMALAYDDSTYSTDGGREIMSRIGVVPSAVSINLGHRDLAQTLAAKKAERETETNE